MASDLHARFLFAIRAEPADDLARLAMADAMEESGEWTEERASLVRVQVELARLTIRSISLANGTRSDEILKVDKERYESLTAEQKRLVEVGGAQCWYSPIMGDPVGGLIAWSRGFIDSLACDARWWLEWGDAVLDQHPLRKVELLTMPTIERVGRKRKAHKGSWPSRDHTGWSIQGRKEIMWFCGSTEIRYRTLQCLKNEWPEVSEFTLPPERPQRVPVLSPAPHGRIQYTGPVNIAVGTPFNDSEGRVIGRVIRDLGEGYVEVDLGEMLGRVNVEAQQAMSDLWEHGRAVIPASHFRLPAVGAARISIGGVDLGETVGPITIVPSGPQNLEPDLFIPEESSIEVTWEDMRIFPRGDEPPVVAP